MDPETAKAIIDWSRPTSRKEVQKLLGPWSLYRRFIHDFSGMVAPIMDLYQQDREFFWREAQEAAILKITILFTSGKTPNLRHYDPNIPALPQTAVSDFVSAEILLQKFKESNIQPFRIVSWKLNPAELNYDLHDKEMLAVVFSFRMNRHFRQGAKHKTTLYSDH
jgi:hypothetical protein